MSYIRELERVFAGRLRINHEPPEAFQAESFDALVRGSTVRDQRCFAWIEHGKKYYVAYHVSQLTKTEETLLRLLLTNHQDETLEKPRWQEEIHAALREAPEPFPRAIRIEDEVEETPVPWSWPVYLIGVRPHDTPKEDTRQELQSALQSLAEASSGEFYFTYDQALVVCVFPRHADEDMHSPRETAEALVDGLVSESFIDARAVYSGAVRSLPELLLTLRRMLFVVMTAEALTPESRVLTAQGLGVYELLFGLRPHLRQAYAAHTITPSVTMTLGAELEQTVMTFVACDLNMSETARKLYLHRNSLLYRIERIRELTGYDVRRFDDAVTVWAALLLRRL
ncbi:PucR family transcriptional regulator [Ferroacidibacillus organovorans]|uniref:PucR C-terminal helix-turn-helix domain-containing protein n=1 Tax=Ferroacidibacillus organovorans TaxID=1765683 RepID=A0A1V4EXH4_9BACL|nr:helix-turn-helix domain-containing protein [Ferroacidibacillus organovorans]OPG17633.1 hypothetical protein B2M26_00305 [Ferroacidibacillus organovorans]